MIKATKIKSTSRELVCGVVTETDRTDIKAGDIVCVGGDWNENENLDGIRIILWLEKSEIAKASKKVKTQKADKNEKDEKTSQTPSKNKK